MSHHGNKKNPAKAREKGHDQTQPGKPGPPQLNHQGRWRRFGPLLLLVTITILTYLNANHEEFYFDSGRGTMQKFADPGQMVGNLLRSHVIPTGYPITQITFALNRWFNHAVGLDDYDVTTYVVVNVFIHAINACLVYFLVRALVGYIAPTSRPALWIPLAAASLFAVHPMQAASVAYVLQRRGALASLFYMLAVLAWLKARKAPANISTVGGKSLTVSHRWPIRRLLLAAAVPFCYWLSYRSKNMGLTLPFAILAVEFCLRAGDRTVLKRYLKIMVPLAGIVLAGILLFIYHLGMFDPGQFKIHNPDPRVTWGAWEHFLTEARAFVHYWKLLWLPLPRWSCIDHYFDVSRHLLDHGAIVALAFHALLLATAVVGARKGYTLASLGVFWFYIALIPYICLPQVELLVEYKTYLPSVGAALIVAELLWRTRNRVGLKRQILIVAAIAIALMATTISRNRIYQSAENLWLDAIAKSPRNPRPYNNLANVYARQGSYEEAIEYYHKALDVQDQDADIWHNLAVCLSRMGRTDEALRYYQKALELEPGRSDTLSALALLENEVGRPERAATLLEEALATALPQEKPDIYYQLGYVLEQAGLPDRAVAAYQESIRLDPNQARVYNNLALLLVRLERFAEAETAWQRALQLDPGNADYHNNYGDALRLQKRAVEAETCFRKALTLAPQMVNAHINLGRALADQNKFEQAVASYRQAQQIEPDNFFVYLFWGEAMACQGQIEGAIELYRQALRIDPRWVNIHCQTADLLRQLGRTAEAAEHYRSALQHDPQNATARAALETMTTSQPKAIEP